MTIKLNQKDEELASEEQKEENRTAIGCLSWLAEQTRPDLQFAVCQAERRQQNPTVGDVKQTNRVVVMSDAHKDKGLRLHRIEEGNMCLIAYHDAAWGNVEHQDPEPRDDEWYGQHTIASQLGNLTLVADKACLEPGGGKFSLVDWRSKASSRVCRSTFAGETMAGCEGYENGVYLRSLMLSLMTGELMTEAQAGRYMELHLVTDCRSLYDHVHREGVPRTPTEKRLAIDLAGLRQGLITEARHQWSKKHPSLDRPTPQAPLKAPMHWLPTSDQLADLLTKNLKPNGWWEVILTGNLALPLKVQPGATEEGRAFETNVEGIHGLLT